MSLTVRSVIPIMDRIVPLQMLLCATWLDSLAIELDVCLNCGCHISDALTKCFVDLIIPQIGEDSFQEWLVATNTSGLSRKGNGSDPIHGFSTSLCNRSRWRSIAAKATQFLIFVLRFVRLKHIITFTLIMR